MWSLNRLSSVRLRRLIGVGAPSVVDADMNEFPAEAFAAAAPVALACAIAGDAVADAIDPAELLDIDMDELAGVLALVAAHRLGRLQRPQPVQSETAQDARHGRRRDAGLARICAPGRLCHINDFYLLLLPLEREPASAASTT